MSSSHLTLHFFDHQLATISNLTYSLSVWIRLAANCRAMEIYMQLAGLQGAKALQLRMARELYIFGYNGNRPPPPSGRGMGMVWNIIGK